MRNLTENLMREKEIVCEQNRTIKLLKIEMSDQLRQRSGSQEELVSLLCERSSFIQSLAETRENLRTLQRQIIDQEDIILHCQQQLQTERYSRDVLLRKLENYSWASHHPHSINLELTSTDEREDFDLSSESYEEDDLCIPLVHTPPTPPPLSRSCFNSYLVTMLILQDWCVGRDQEKHSCLSSVVQIFGCRRGQGGYRDRLVMWPQRSPHISPISVPHLTLPTLILSGRG